MRGVWVALRCPAAPGGPRAASRGDRRGAASSGLGRGRRAHLHLRHAVRPFRSVTNRMSSLPGHSPCPAPSSVSSSFANTSARPSVSPRGADCPPHTGGSPAGAGASAVAPAGGGAGGLRMHDAGAMSPVLLPELAWRRRRLLFCRWGRGRGQARFAAGPGPGLRPAGSGRACCSEPRVARGTGAARVGTPLAPGPGPAAAACA